MEPISQAGEEEDGTFLVQSERPAGASLTLSLIGKEQIFTCTAIYTNAKSSLLIFMPDKPEAPISVGVCVSRFVHLPFTSFELEVCSTFAVSLSLNCWLGGLFIYTTVLSAQAIEIFYFMWFYQCLLTFLKRLLHGSLTFLHGLSILVAPSYF